MTPVSADRRLRTPTLQLARAQLTLVEHALCPLDHHVSLAQGLRHETRVRFTDAERQRREAIVQVGAIDGLSAHDEFYLWGLLALALSQPEPTADFRATPYYCLSRLGLITADKRGGREFALFRAALRRLAGVRYQNDLFYDPLRGEHRSVSFGFLNYSLPLDPDSARTWRFAWDPIFFELAQATGGALSFDLATYRDLDAAARRLYLYLKKLFWRRSVTLPVELRHLAIDVVGFSPALSTPELKGKLARVVARLAERELIRFPTGVTRPQELFRKQDVGVYTIAFERGPGFERSAPIVRLQHADSPLVEPLRAIGLVANAIERVLKTYPPSLVTEWADITLAARERNGERFFKKSAAAYLIDNLKQAAQGRRTAPDWWRELRRQELAQESAQEVRKRGMRDSRANEAEFDEYLRTEAREAFERAMNKLASELRGGGQREDDARRNAEYHARMHFHHQFLRNHPEQARDEGPASLGELLARREA